MWYQSGKAPGVLPESVFNSEGLSVSNLSVYPESTLNSWGWFKCPALVSYDSLYYTHSWEEPNWIYTPRTYEERLAKINSKKSKYIRLLQTFYREARYSAVDDSSSNTKLTDYLNSIKTEIARIRDDLVYGDASIQDTLKDISNQSTAKTADGAFENGSDTSKNSDALDFWYDYSNNSMKVTQIGGLGLV